MSSLTQKSKDQELEISISNAADQFAKLYYEAFDKRRAVVPKFYMDSCCMVWNGHPMTGLAAVGPFLTSLPESEFTVASLDAQPVSEKFTGGNNTMLVLVAGSVRFGARNHSFTQTFILTAQEDKWRIASDRFRFAD